MNLTELKNKSIKELVQLAENMKLENMARARKQDIIFSILKAHAKSGEDIFGNGVLEILQDGYFLDNTASSVDTITDILRLHLYYIAVLHNFPWDRLLELDESLCFMVYEKEILGLS